MLTARRTLEAAHFFLSEAEKAAKAQKRDKLHYNLEAAIVYGRSVTFHLQKQLTGMAGFDDWYGSIQKRLGADGIAHRMLQLRNLILKEGPTEVRRSVQVEIVEQVAVSASFDAVVVRGRPWYRPSPRIWWQDISAGIHRRLRAIRRKYPRKRSPATRQTKTRTTDRYYFDDPEFASRSAFAVVHHYLALLEDIVAEGEGRFPTDA